jgi:ribulose-phosphate 3-epimerase
VRPVVALGLDLEVETVAPLLAGVERVLVMGTEIGVKGADAAPETCERVRRVVALRAGERPEVFVDGGIREGAPAGFAAAGADGVVPGSLVFACADWREGVRLVHAA